MKKQLWFSTKLFEPIPGEEDETNPGRYGKQLAEWLKKKLSQNGRLIEESIIPEDWGWLIMVQRKPFSLWVGCGNEDGSSDRWSVFVEAEPSLVQKIFKKVDTEPSMIKLRDEVEAIIRAEQSITNVEWEQL